MSETKKTKLQTFVLALGILVAVVAVVVLIFSIMLNATQPLNAYHYKGSSGDTVFMAYARFCNAMRKSLIGQADYYKPDEVATSSFLFGLFCCLAGTAWLVLAIIKKKFIHIVYFFASVLVGFGVSFGFFLGTESEHYKWMPNYASQSGLGFLIFVLAYVLLIAYTAFFVLNILSLVKLGKKEKAEEAKEEPAKVEEKKEPAVEEKKEEPKAEEKPAPAVVKEEPKAEEEKKEEAPKAEEKPAEKA